MRLCQGRYDDATVYARDPAEQAARFAAAGIPRLHVVDLDGAQGGSARERATRCARSSRAVARSRCSSAAACATSRPFERRSRWASTASCSAPSRCAIPSWCARRRARFPGRVAVGIDAKDGRVAVEGWTEASEARAVELARRFEDAGVAALIHTDIARDGMLEGPNLEASLELADAVSIPVIVSGGVRSADDVLARRALAARGIAGAIVGRALYTGALDLGAALARSGARACC